MSLADKILKKFKSDEAIKSFKDVDMFKDTKGWLPSGSPLLDLKLNILGFPVGIIEIRGESRSGKTSLALHAIKSFQKNHPEGIAVILSTERRDNKPYAIRIGVDVDNVVIAQCRTIEMVFNKVQQIVDATEEIWKAEGKEGKPKFIFVWDSLGGSISAQERNAMVKAAEGDSEDDQFKAAMGAAARANKRGMRFLQGEVYDKDIWFIIINHTYDSIGGFGGKNSYGGNGIEYMPSLRLSMVRTGFVKLRDIKRGQAGFVEVVKSDFNGTLEKIPIELNLGKGLILTDDELELACEHKILEPKGKNGYSFMDGKLSWTSKAQLYDIHDAGNPFYALLVKKIYKLCNELVIQNREAAVKPNDIPEVEE